MRRICSLFLPAISMLLLPLFEHESRRLHPRSLGPASSSACMTYLHACTCMLTCAYVWLRGCVCVCARLRVRVRRCVRKCVGVRLRVCVHEGVRMSLTCLKVIFDRRLPYYTYQAISSWISYRIDFLFRSFFFHGGCWLSFKFPQICIPLWRHRLLFFLSDVSSAPVFAPLSLKRVFRV